MHDALTSTTTDKGECTAMLDEEHFSSITLRRDMPSLIDVDVAVATARRITDVIVFDAIVIP